jgi:hypothetical protein
MRISGFTMIKNATKLYYPIREAIESILPICDEFVVALGDCDPDDKTYEEIQRIGSDKIKIIHTVWDLNKYPRGTENAHQTDIAKNACTGDWCFYVQADEVVHEKYLPVIKARCEELLHNKEVDGLLFKYRHFWGDYDHYNDAHTWYYQEIRIVRNDPDIHSWWSAQSFRRISNFDGVSYRHKPGTQKLNVAPVDAYIYHYGFVRPPQYMQSKRKALHTIHHGKEKTQNDFKAQTNEFDYGDLSKVKLFTETHPAVMKDFIARFNWKDKLRYDGKGGRSASNLKHETLKNKVITLIEQTFFGGRQPFAYKNYRVINPEKRKAQG